ncbi:4-amino-4-deoxy-L-arabinose-phosphoundecaprenol flippase subunit ArnE [compost metagenome]|jgi:drug/metabolite transporter (DMT)-like permease
MKTFVSLAGMILSMTASQILLKFAGQHSAAHAGAVDSFVLNPWLWAALTASVSGIGFWLMALRRLPLSAAYSWTALIYVITPLASTWFFSDVLTSRYVFGLTLVLAGVVLTSRGVMQR